MKTNTILFSIIVILLLSKTLSVKAFEVDNIAYQVTSEVIANGKCQGDIIVPEKVVHNGIVYIVTGIASRAFAGCECLTSIELPEAIESIGERAFVQCKMLKDFQLPKELRSIGDYAFAGCTLLTNLKIPDKVFSIGSNAFRYCENMQKILLPDSLQIIGTSVFFASCNLSIIEINDSNTNFCTNDGVLFNKDTTSLIAFPAGKELKDSLYIMPSKVITIMPFAFTLCRFLKNVSLSDSLESIGLWAFNGCLNLESVFLTCNVSKIEFGAFFNTNSLIRFEVDELNPYYSGYNGVVLNNDKSVLVLRPDGMRDQPNLPKTVTSVARGASTTRNDGIPIIENCR